MHLATRTRLIIWLSLFLTVGMASLPLVALAGNFKPPSRGVPGRREGGGTRDGCTLGNASTRPMRALLPAFMEEETNQQKKMAAIGLTTRAYPRFFWYMPQTQSGKVAFTLYRGDKESPEAVVYQTTFEPSRPQTTAGGRQVSQAGIYSLTLPENANVAPLEVGKVYRWSVELLCPGIKAGTLSVGGGVERVPVDARLASALKGTPDPTNIYAENGLWFDLVETLAQRRCSPNSGSMAPWQELLKSEEVKLGAIATAPVACGR